MIFAEALAGASWLEALVSRARELRAQARARARGGEDAASVSEFISASNDAICTRAIELAGANRVPGVEVCWIVMGSQGRREQTLHTDQDNAIVFHGDVDPHEVRRTLAPLARIANEHIAACSIPLCSGGIMGGNPKWCLSLDEWKQRFAEWIDHADPPALLNAAIFFDFRPLAGVTGLADELRGWLAERAQGHSRFLLQLTMAALENRPPLGVLGGFRLATHGGIRRTLDLKVNAVTPFVDGARIYGLAGGIEETATAARLVGAAEIGGVSPMRVRAWLDALGRVQNLRLRVQALELDALGQGGNIVDPSQLSSDDRRLLKNAMREALRLQQCLAQDFAALAPGFGA